MLTRGSFVQVAAVCRGCLLPKRHPGCWQILRQLSLWVFSGHKFVRGAGRGWQWKLRPQISVQPSQEISDERPQHLWVAYNSALLRARDQVPERSSRSCRCCTLPRRQRQDWVVLLVAHAVDGRVHHGCRVARLFRSTAHRCLLVGADCCKTIATLSRRGHATVLCMRANVLV